MEHLQTKTAATSVHQVNKPRRIPSTVQKIECDKKKSCFLSIKSVSYNILYSTSFCKLFNLCTSLNFRGFQFAQAMLFAIDEINKSPNLLPGILLGYKIYDACASIARSVEVALALANGNQVESTSLKGPCPKPAPVQAIMGETASSPCMAIATVIGPFHIPLVSRRNRYEYVWCLRL